MSAFVGLCVGGIWVVVGTPSVRPLGDINTIWHAGAWYRTLVKAQRSEYVTIRKTETLGAYSPNYQIDSQLIIKRRCIKTQN